MKHDALVAPVRHADAPVSATPAGVRGGQADDLASVCRPVTGPDARVRGGVSALWFSHAAW
jgi:hypothetical protein